MSYAIIGTADAGMVNYDNVGVLLIKDKSAFPGISNSVFVSLQPALTYRLNNDVVLGFSPTARLSLNSMIDRSNWLKQYPAFLGGGLFITRFF